MHHICNSLTISYSAKYVRDKTENKFLKNWFIVQALFINIVNSETVNLEPTETCVVRGENKMTAQIFLLNVCSKLLPNQNCQRVWNMSVFVPFSVAINQVLKKRGCKYFITYLIFPLAKLLWVTYFEKKMCW